MSIKLDEATRKQLIDKSRDADIVKSYGTTRYERKNRQHIYDTISNFNKVDMNALFKGNMLSFLLPIHGETNNYEVEVLFEGICDDIKREVKLNKNKIEYKCVYRALVDAVNNQDIYVSCTCSDFKYRMAYWATNGRYNGGKPELRPAKITNPNNSKGAGCKHILNVLSNLDWAMKLASVINNYIDYMRENFEDKYSRIIHPAISDIPYNKYIQLNLFDNDDELANSMDNEEDIEEIDNSNKKPVYNPESEEPEDDSEDEIKN